MTNRIPPIEMNPASQHWLYKKYKDNKRKNRMPKLLCKIGIHRWNMFNSIYRLETGVLVSLEDAVYAKQKVKEGISYSICKSCGKIKIDVHQKWKTGTETFGDNLIHDNNNGLLETVVWEYLKKE